MLRFWGSDDVLPSVESEGERRSRVLAGIVAALFIGVGVGLLYAHVIPYDDRIVAMLMFLGIGVFAIIVGRVWLLF